MSSLAGWHAPSGLTWRLIPRLNKLINTYYPGTKLGITEWNFGGENDISGAIATADTLGILGREGVYTANYWTVPKQDSPAGWAFRVYRNYDGKGSTFGTQSVETTSSDTNTVSAYGALNTEGSKLTMMLINKDRSRHRGSGVAASGLCSWQNGHRLQLQ